MPSFLPLKLNVFIAGLLVADAMGRTGLARYLTLGLAVAISGLSVGQAADLTHIAVRCACTMALALMVEPARYPGAGWLRAAARALGGRLGHWLGELSYSVYLIHLLFLTPIASLLITAGLRGLPLFASSFALTVAFSYAAAGALHIWVEKPGIAAGKYFNAWSGLRPAVAKAR
jgi:peptidoglycan/LPS O-acetylase OafA/YrhL